MLINKICVLVFLVNTIFSEAVYKPYSEGIYLSEATPELVEKALTAASKVGYNGNFELSIAQKAGMEINPHNRFISKCTNPVTKNDLIIINVDWFNKLTNDEQQCWLISFFAQFKEPNHNAKYQTIFAVFLSLLTFFLLFIFLRYTKLATKSVWIRLAVSFALLLLIEITILDKMMALVSANISRAYQRKIDKETLSFVDKELLIKIQKDFTEDLQSIQDCGPAYAAYARAIAAGLPNRIRDIQNI